MKARLSVEPGHAWCPPFGLERVGRPLDAVVETASDAPPAEQFVVVSYRAGKEVSRQTVTFPGGKAPWIGRVALEAWPSEVALWTKAEPQELARAQVTLPAFEAEAIARADKAIHPVDLGTILVPADWLLLAGGQKASVEVAALSRSGDVSAARATAWYESAPRKKVTAAMPLAQGRKAQVSLALGPCSKSLERDVLHVAITGADGKELWHKQIRAMIVPKPPKRPEFGAVATKLRYDAPILSVVGGKYMSLSYDDAWAPELDDVVVFLPNGARWVFWRGSCYIPFWAGKHNTGLCYEWAERHSPNTGFTDCPEPLMDKELRYGRVEIVESTAARVHVRWNYQSCDFNYRVNGDLPVEDYYFYPDGFGTRVLTLTCIPEAQYELAEFIILSPQGAFPLDILPRDPCDALPVKKGSRLPAVYRVRLSQHDSMAAISFCPTLTGDPSPFRPFFDRGCQVTRAYWGSHWPLTRGCNTGWSINDRIALGPAHNSLMTWGATRPTPLRSETVETKDGLGQVKTMKVQTWAWLIGMTDAGDEALVQWAQSFAQPPALELQGARQDAQPYAPERRALRLVVEARDVTIAIKPVGCCVNPVFELQGAPKEFRRVELAGRALSRKQYTWDGRTLWLSAALREPTVLRLGYAP
ncbi:MAG: hypothetical protein FJ290_26670 [Planctomycetes bacterium]|nr:hypothetical protein [Planctomycetota bacterium]